MKAFTLDDYVEKKKKSSKFKTEYEREILINAIAKMIVELRYSAQLTQEELAKKAKTTQAVIARLESGKDERVPSIALLSRIAEASHARLNISFEQE
jgi:ribosome-binding protein aMBF1 (putative translation factor)